MIFKLKLVIRPEFHYRFPFDSDFAPNQLLWGSGYFRRQNLYFQIRRWEFVGVTHEIRSARSWACPHSFAPSDSTTSSGWSLRCFWDPRFFHLMLVTANLGVCRDLLWFEVAWFVCRPFREYPFSDCCPQCWILLDHWHSSYFLTGSLQSFPEELVHYLAIALLWWSQRWCWSGVAATRVTGLLGFY